MPLFECESCLFVENTALCHYWSSKVIDKEKALFSEFYPDINKLHDRFKKSSAKGMLIDQNGHLWSKEQVDGGLFPKHYKIVGEVE